MTSNDTSAGVKVVVTGVTGLLGWALACECGPTFRLYGIARNPRAIPLSCETRAVDLVDGPSVARVLEDIAPDVLIHCAALTSVDDCEKNPNAASAVNVSGTQNLLKGLDGHPCKFIYISTDSVFDGARGDYTEDDLPNPLTVYARTKLEAEEVVLAARPDALVARTVFYGWNALVQQSLSEWILSRLRSGQEVPGFEDVHFSPMVSSELARCLFGLALNPASGILHLAGSEGCSKYEFARRLAITFGFPPEGVVSTKLEDAKLSVPRPKNVTLSVKRAAKVLGKLPFGVDEGLAEFKVREPDQIQ